MSFDTDDDLDEIFSDDDFGDEIIFKGRKFTGIHNQEFTQPEDTVEPDENESTVVYVDSRNVLDAAIDDPIIVNKISLYIRAIQPDGTGVTILVCSDEP